MCDGGWDGGELWCVVCERDDALRRVGVNYKKKW